MIPIFFVGLYCVGKTSILFKNGECLPKQLSKIGYRAKAYSLDNYKIYNKSSTLLSQIDRMYYGARKLGEAIQESPEIALFDRSLFCNILFSKTFMCHSKMTEDEFSILQKVFKGMKHSDICFNGTIIYLKPPLETIYENLAARNGLKKLPKDMNEANAMGINFKATRDGAGCPILLTKDFISDLEYVYTEFYEQLSMTLPVYTFTDYNEKTIMSNLNKHDILQNMVD